MRRYVVFWFENLARTATGRRAYRCDLPRYVLDEADSREDCAAGSRKPIGVCWGAKVRGATERGIPGRVAEVVSAMRKGNCSTSMGQCQEHRWFRQRPMVISSDFRLSSQASSEDASAGI